MLVPGGLMFNEIDYAVIWAAYLASALVLMVAVWRLSKGIPVWVRDPVRAIALVVLLMPELVDPARGLYAPTLFVAGFELATAGEGGTGVVLGVRLLLAAMLAAFVAWGARILWFWLFGRRHAGKRALS